MSMSNPQASTSSTSPRTEGELDLIATCTFGLESVVVRELEQLGYDAKVESTGRVVFQGDARAICETNLWLRAADRVLVRMASFDVGGGDEGFERLFQGVKDTPWERFVAREAAINVSGRTVRSLITSEPALQRATKKAIVDRLQRVYGRGGVPALLPETGPRVEIEVALLNDRATLTIDTSGVGLHKRGYREGTPGEAALRETLAAGLVLLSVWRPGRPLVDPFCGSGTIAIEAALIARSIAPGLNRSFDSERWHKPFGEPGQLCIDAGLWREAREEAEGAIVPGRVTPPIHASDVDEGVLALARHNAKAAGVERDIHFVKRDVAELSTSLDYGSIITNPPYGVRLGDDREIERLYRSLPAVFRKLPTWSFHILSGRLDLEHLFGQAATRRRKLYNARIETTYFTFLGPKPPVAPRSGDAAPTSAGDAVAASETDDADAIEHSESAAIAAGSAVSAPAPTAPARFASSSNIPPTPTAPTFGGLRERDQREATEFLRCLSNNLRHLRRYPSRGVTCYRVYERDVPDVPLIVDRYEDWYHAAEYERRHSRTPAQQADWFDLMRATIAKAAGVDPARVIMKEKHRQRGLSQHEKLGAHGRTLVVQEGGLRFEVNLLDYIDTGLFLDHRLTRGMVREASAGKKLLNLFCYTGSFTTYAAAGGASATTSVDLSNTYLEWTKRNLGLNGLYASSHELVRSDVLEFLTDARRTRAGTYDLAVVDPPTFSNSSSTEVDWQVQDQHIELLSGVRTLMREGGTVYFSTNFRRFKLDEDAMATAGLSVHEISRTTVPPEYRNRRIHRCWRLLAATPEQAKASLEQRRARAAARGEPETLPDELDDQGV